MSFDDGYRITNLHEVSGGRWQRVGGRLVFHIRLLIFNRRFENFVADGDEAATGEGARWMTVLSASFN